MALWTAFGIGFAAAILATPHCLGMCGGFPLHLAKGSSRGGVLSKQVLFILGKSFTYMFLGAMAAGVGVIVLKDTSLAKAVPTLRIAAGSLTALFGLLMLGLRIPRLKPLKGITDTGFVRSIFGGLLTNPGPGAALTLGIGVGFLPCPLPIAMLAASVASHSVTHGIALMAGVGLGTAPGLVAVGMLGTGLDRRFAKYGMRLAGVVVLTIGLLTIGRASGIIHTAHATDRPAPACCGSELPR